MDTAVVTEKFSLTMKRDFNASKQDVYDAWINSDALKSWFAPSSEMETRVHILEPHVGGKFKIEMIEPDGNTHRIHGEYVELNPFDQLVFTWKWESDTQNVNSLVTIDLVENDGVTNLVLTHDKLASQASVELHTFGWTGCISQLEGFINS